MTLKKIAIIPARSGSKGLPNKNILMLLEKPLIAYSIEAAVDSGQFERVIVSTDSLEYKQIAESYGAEVILRGESLASDTATSFMVIEDVLLKTEDTDYDYFVLLQPTSPFRSSEHINEAISIFEEQYSNGVNFLVSMVESDKSSTLIQCLDENQSLKNFDLDFSNYRRQDSKEFTPNGAIFIGKNQQYLEKKHFFGADSLAYVMNKEDSIDIDDHLDFELAITIATKKNKQKILLETIKRRVAEKKDQMNDVKPITLIGHSIFDYWDVSELSGLAVNNLGIAGISTKEYLDLILRKKIINKIGDKVFLFSGTNDIVIDGWSNKDTLCWIKETICLLKAINDSCEIVLVSVPNVRGRIDRSNTTINDLNLFLKDKLHAELEIIELGPEFLDEFGNLKEECTYDGLHFTQYAYQLLQATLEKNLQ